MSDAMPTRDAKPVVQCGWERLRGLDLAVMQRGYAVYADVRDVQFFGLYLIGDVLRRAGGVIEDVAIICAVLV